MSLGLGNDFGRVIFLLYLQLALPFCDSFPNGRCPPPWQEEPTIRSLGRAAFCSELFLIRGPEHKIEGFDRNVTLNFTYLGRRVLRIFLFSLEKYPQFIPSAGPLAVTRPRGMGLLFGSVAISTFSSAIAHQCGRLGLWLYVT